MQRKLAPVVREWSLPKRAGFNIAPEVGEEEEGDSRKGRKAPEETRKFDSGISVLAFGLGYFAVSVLPPLPTRTRPAANLG